VTPVIINGGVIKNQFIRAPEAGIIALVKVPSLRLFVFAVEIGILHTIEAAASIGVLIQLHGQVVGVEIAADH